MKISGECANFEIDSSITIPADTTSPFVITNRVNMRHVLGDMYKKYKKFYIQFNSFAAFASSNAISYSGINPPTLPAGQTALVWTLGMSGDLIFLSNTVNGLPTSIGYFGLRFQLPVNGHGLLNTPATGYGIVFELPPNETVTINLSPYNIRGGTQAQLGSVGTQSIFEINCNFSIYGLYEDD